MKTRVMTPQDHLWVPEAGRGQKGPSLKFQREHSPTSILILDFSLQNCEIITFCGSKPPGLWNFVTGALGNECTRGYYSFQLVVEETESEEFLQALLAGVVG